MSEEQNGENPPSVRSRPPKLPKPHTNRPTNQGDAPQTGDTTFPLVGSADGVSLAILTEVRAAIALLTTTQDASGKPIPVTKQAVEEMLIAALTVTANSVETQQTQAAIQTNTALAEMGKIVTRAMEATSHSAGSTEIIDGIEKQIGDMSRGIRRGQLRATDVQGMELIKAAASKVTPTDRKHTRITLLLMYLPNLLIFEFNEGGGTVKRFSLRQIARKVIERAFPDTPELHSAMTSCFIVKDSEVQVEDLRRINVKCIFRTKEDRDLAYRTTRDCLRISEGTVVSEKPEHHGRRKVVLTDFFQGALYEMYSLLGNKGEKILSSNSLWVTDYQVKAGIGEYPGLHLSLKRDLAAKSSSAPEGAHEWNMVFVPLATLESDTMDVGELMIDTEGSLVSKAVFEKEKREGTTLPPVWTEIRDYNKKPGAVIQGKKHAVCYTLTDLLSIPISAKQQKEVDSRNSIEDKDFSEGKHRCIKAIHCCIRLAEKGTLKKELEGQTGQNMERVEELFDLSEFGPLYSQLVAANPGRDVKKTYSTDVLKTREGFAHISEKELREMKNTHPDKKMNKVLWAMFKRATREKNEDEQKPAERGPTGIKSSDAEKLLNTSTYRPGDHQLRLERQRGQQELQTVGEETGESEEESQDSQASEEEEQGTNDEQENEGTATGSGATGFNNELSSIDGADGNGMEEIQRLTPQPRKNPRNSASNLKSSSPIMADMADMADMSNTLIPSKPTTPRQDETRSVLENMFDGGSILNPANWPPLLQRKNEKRGKASTSAAPDPTTTRSGIAAPAGHLPPEPVNTAATTQKTPTTPAESVQGATAATPAATGTGTSTSTKAQVHQEPGTEAGRLVKLNLTGSQVELGIMDHTRGALNDLHLSNDPFAVYGNSTGEGATAGGAAAAPVDPATPKQQKQQTFASIFSGAKGNASPSPAAQRLKVPVTPNPHQRSGSQAGAHSESTEESGGDEDRSTEGSSQSANGTAPSLRLGTRRAKAKTKTVKKLKKPAK
jgi:hypothetical protein